MTQIEQIFTDLLLLCVPLSLCAFVLSFSVSVVSPSDIVHSFLLKLSQQSHNEKQTTTGILIV